MAYFRTPVDDRLIRYDHLIVHCTATGPDQNEVDAQWIDNVHKNKGWSGCGYHAVITRSGEVQVHDDGYKARPITRQGSHVGACGRGWNYRSLGVSLAGGVDNNQRPSNNFEKSQYDALANFIDEFLNSHPSPETVIIMGHRDLIRETGAPAKACPCFDVEEFITERKLLSGDEDLDAPEPNSTMYLPDTYQVEAGDSLWKISNLFGVSIKSIQEQNDIQGDTIHPGQVLNIKQT